MFAVDLAQFSKKATHYRAIGLVKCQAISLVSGEDRQPQFLFQCISVAIQRFNAVLLHDNFFLSSDHPD